MRKVQNRTDKKYAAHVSAYYRTTTQMKRIRKIAKD
jgi:hypothetical protein